MAKSELARVRAPAPPRLGARGTGAARRPPRMQRAPGAPPPAQRRSGVAQALPPMGGLGSGAGDRA
eukprot:8171266-Alexandrium_andersonii.AAC.1